MAGNNEDDDMKKYPHEFLGRCQTCLDNAYLSSKPCRTGYGNGMPLHDGECMIACAQQRYDAEQAAKRKGLDIARDVL